ncbi:hypothetical protein ACQZ5N_25855 [Agrobacterium sp. 22-221-1]
MSLTVQFGACSPAARPISDAERSFKPASLQKLDSLTAPHLKSYIDSAAGLLATQVVGCHCAMLWVVDEHGDIHFALEELVDENTGVSVAVKPRADLGPIEGTIKLGHPALISHPSKNARIGGEILYDRVAKVWEINNRSGRYGIRRQANPSHLVEAAKKFNALCGIVLKPVFSKPRASK